MNILQLLQARRGPRADGAPASDWRPPFFLLLAVTALLVWLEVQYNVSLLNSISDPATTPEQADDLSSRGKLLAAFGLTWALFRGLLFKGRSLVWGVIGLGLLTGAGYWALDTVYARVIDNLKPEVKVMGFNLLSYRRDLLTGELEDPDIPSLKDSPVTSRIFMGAFPIVLLDQRFMVPAQDIVERKASDKQNEALQISDEKWSEYAENMDALRKAHVRYIDSSRKAKGIGLEADWQSYGREMEKLASGHARYLQAVRRARREADLTGEWAAYERNMNDVRAGHREFIEGSAKAARYGSRGTAEFRRRSGGLDPNTQLPLQQFPSLMKRSSHPRAAQMRQAEARVIGHDFDGRPIHAREMPYFMSRAEFEQWTARKAHDVLAAANFPVDPGLSKDDFVALLRKSEGKNGQDLRQHERKEIGHKPDGSAVLAGAMPYFMHREGFLAWTGSLVRESMAAQAMPPDESLSLAQFVALLRKSTGKDGERLRKAEGQLVTKRPDGSALLVRDVPYFMSRAQYQDWVAAEAQRMKAMAMPTVENVNTLKNIQQVNAAVFIPPMAIISSLTSALVNAISLVLLVASWALMRSATAAPAGRMLRRYSVVLMLAIFGALVAAMPSHVFDQGTALYDLENTLHREVGSVSMLWSRLSNIQKYFL